MLNSGFLLREIESLMPEEEDFRVRCEADLYGVSCFIASKLHLPFVPMSLKGWRHGWVYDLKYPEQITLGSKADGFLVALKEHELFLKKYGINAIAVGMPFIYVDENKEIKRMPNSLLVMPIHTLAYTSHSMNEYNYIQQISKLKKDFDLIVVCIHAECYKKNYWIDACNAFDLPYIKGASLRDKNSLIRMRRLFNSFEYMTTNHIGSHILYATFCGCKVSIYGNYYEYNKKDFLCDPFYKKYPHILDHNLYIGSEDYVKRKFPQFFVFPKDAKPMEEWANEEIGLQYKKSYLGIASLLGWTNIYRQSKLFFTKFLKAIVKKILALFYLLLDYLYVIIFFYIKSFIPKYITFALINTINKSYMIVERLQNYYIKVNNINLFRDDYYNKTTKLLEKHIGNKNIYNKKIAISDIFSESNDDFHRIYNGCEFFFLTFSKKGISIFPHKSQENNDVKDFKKYFDEIYVFMFFEFIEKDKIQSILKKFYDILNDTGEVIIIFQSYFDRFGSKGFLYSYHPWPQLIFNEKYFVDYCKYKFDLLDQKDLIYPYDYILTGKTEYTLNRLSQTEFKEHIINSPFKLSNIFSVNRNIFVNLLSNLFPRIKIFDGTKAYILKK